MRVKAIQDLSQLTDDALYAEIAAGAAICFSNSHQIYSDSLLLNQLRRPAGSEILRLAAEEEAAKVLILVDAVRCPRIERQSDFNRQLQYFNDHLAKGIYAQYPWRHPHSFSEVREWVNRERKEYYLDGPNSVDWIFYNEILRQREETIYVDYVENDGVHFWHDPRRTDELGLMPVSSESPTLRLVSALSKAGCLKSAALHILAKIWRAQPIDENLTMQALFDLNNKSLESLHAGGVLETQDADVINEIANRWLFPLYPLDLRKDRVSKEELRNFQRNWF
jgi:AbiV family abortive infection protein